MKLFLNISRRYFSSKAVKYDSYPTGIKLFNSLNREKTVFSAKNQNIVTWYMCGPTVYDSAHMGHASCYMKFDILRRIMEEFFQLNVVQVMGITDIDDKIINRAKQENVDFRDITRKYEREFKSELSKLGIRDPFLFTRVSDYIPEILQFVKKIVDQGLGYHTPDGSVYFDVAKYSLSNKYGKLSPSGDSSGEPENPDKKSALDFALWKGTKHEWEPSWNTPWGTKGRPGWHIECSAMASHVFGPSLDLHSGGIDLLFPHHENEEAQCCAYHQTENWSRYWIHTGHLHLSGNAKMSKSLKNTVSIQQFLEKHSPEHLRMLCVLSHYRNHIEFDESKLDVAKGVSRKISDFLADCDAYIHGRLPSASIDEALLNTKIGETKSTVHNCLSDDFSTARALDTVLELISTTSKQLRIKKGTTGGSGVGTVGAVSNFVTCFMKNLGFYSNVEEKVSSSSSAILDDVIQFRNKVRLYGLAMDEPSVSLTKQEKSETRKRRASLMQACDELRNNLQNQGIKIKDHGTQSSWEVSDPSRK